MRLSGVHVASAQGIEDSARDGTEHTHCWNAFLVTFVSAVMGAQRTWSEIGAWGGCEGMGVLPSGRPLPLLSGEGSSSSVRVRRLGVVTTFDVVVFVVLVEVVSAKLCVVLFSALLLGKVRTTG